MREEDEEPRVGLGAGDEGGDEGDLLRLRGRRLPRAAQHEQAADGQVDAHVGQERLRPDVLHNELEDLEVKCEVKSEVIKSRRVKSSQGKLPLNLNST